MEQTVELMFTPAEIKDILSAIEDAQNELCLAPNMVEAHAINNRWNKIAHYLEVKLRDAQ